VVDDAVSNIDGDVVGVVGDVAVLTALDALYATIAERSGRLDVLVANAGGAQVAGLADITEEHYDTTFDANVKGLVFTVQKALPLLQNGASIVLLSSVAGIKGLAGVSVYATTKAAIRNFARSWAVELAPRGIRVTALCPGPVDTPGLAGFAAQVPSDAAASSSGICGCHRSRVRTVSGCPPTIFEILHRVDDQSAGRVVGRNPGRHHRPEAF